jgi:hypothetical protein
LNPGAELGQRIAGIIQHGLGFCDGLLQTGDHQSSFDRKWRYIVILFVPAASAIASTPIPWSPYLRNNSRAVRSLGLFPMTPQFSATILAEYFVPTP